MLLLAFECFVFMLMYGNPLFSKCSVAGEMGDHRYNAYFVDLFVRASNRPAITMYEKVHELLCDLLLSAWWNHPHSLC
jgi:hypothetical protein